MSRQRVAGRDQKLHGKMCGKYLVFIFLFYTFLFGEQITTAVPFWKYADENTMHGRYRALHAAIAKYKEEVAEVPPISYIDKILNLISELFTKYGMSKNK